ncbi:MAG: hypothetical protein ACD_29C00352G0007 [uncultured bacterium]|nr:MAG: hypothetical protein ACD_29C00352G0007 [uncultured bacterium]
MTISLIVAKTKNHVIGFESKMPWHLPADLKHFKIITMGKPIVMGRKTFESIGKVLPGRRNIIISRQKDLKILHGEVFSSLDAVFSALKSEKEIIIIGGAEIYKQALHFADRIYLTIIETELKGDAFFSDLNLSKWKLVSEEKLPPDERNIYPLCFQVFERFI